ncbi:MAG TPA: hypothetical protein VLV83_05625, partial [Acidobacteriota bacterium]|nr:hypothetical protein [Acidobacteriota bacterium]
ALGCHDFNGLADRVTLRTNGLGQQMHGIARFLQVEDDKFIALWDEGGCRQKGIEQIFIDLAEREIRSKSLSRQRRWSKAQAQKDPCENENGPQVCSGHPLTL